MDEADLAYLAAVIDTQGRISTRQVREAVLPQLAVSGPNESLLRWLGDITGVRPVVTARDYGRHPCAVHCVEPHQHVRSLSGRWSVSGAKATVVLHAVLPYLRFQRDEALQAVELGLASRYKPATVVKMQALGWIPPVFGSDSELRGQALGC